MLLHYPQTSATLLRPLEPILAINANSFGAQTLYALLHRLSRDFRVPLPPKKSRWVPGCQAAPFRRVGPSVLS
eukprot:scaffold1696_cov258-Pinguiococcus_pyrenoidosus.AAC.39